MQTFLPYNDAIKSAKCLDYKRLGKQRVEAFQIINVLEGNGKRNKNGNVAWEHHPAVLMWKGYELALKIYCNIMINEWISRGYNNTMKLYSLSNKEISLLKSPFWFGNERFHASHRSNLLRKDYNFYSKYGWKESADMEYYWPVMK